MCKAQKVIIQVSSETFRILRVDRYKLFLKDFFYPLIYKLKMYCDFLRIKMIVTESQRNGGDKAPKSKSQGSH